MYHAHLATHVHMYLSIDQLIDFYQSIYLLLVRSFLVTFGNPTIYSSGLVAGETLKSQCCIYVQYCEFLQIRTLNLPVFFEPNRYNLFLLRGRQSEEKPPLATQELLCLRLLFRIV